MEFFRQNLPDINANIRVLHALPDAPNVDVYANGKIICTNLDFGSISDYIQLAADTYEFQIYRSGFYDTPLLTQNLQLSPGSNYTTSIVSLNGNIFFFKLRDASITSSITSSYLRFINLSESAPLLTLSLPNDISLFNSVEYLETTGYYPLSSGIYNFKVSFSSANIVAKNIKTVELDNGKLYTIYIIGKLTGKPPLGYLLVNDKK